MATINFRVDESVKSQAAKVFEELGLDVTTALNIFLRAAIYYNGIPFEIRRPNPETLEAMQEAERIAKDDTVPSYSNIEDLMEALDR